MGDNLDSVDHGVHDEDGGRGLGMVVGDVDTHVGHEDTTIWLGAVRCWPKQKNVPMLCIMKNIFLDTWEDEHKLRRGFFFIH